MSHCISSGKRNGWLAPYLPEEVAQHSTSLLRPDGFEVVTRILVSPIAYNTNLVKKEVEAPKSFADLARSDNGRARWSRRIPAYSGTIMNATFQIARDLGWGYLEKLSQQSVMQVQSATDTPKRISLGETRRHGDGRRLSGHSQQGGGQPVEIVYPTEARRSPPGRARCSRPRPSERSTPVPETGCTRARDSKILVDHARQYAPHKQTVEKPGIRKLADIKLMKEDPAGVEKAPRKSSGATRRYSRCDVLLLTLVSNPRRQW